VPDGASVSRARDVREARDLSPATADRAYFNTAAVGLASRPMAERLRELVDEWASDGLDFVRGEEDAEASRAMVARLIGADVGDVALIASVSSTAGFVAAQLGPGGPGANVVIGEREYSSNHFPWRQLVRRGYDVRQVPFRHGGIEPEDVAARADGGTRLVAFSGVQTATGHRSDVAALSGIARSVGALVVVDGAQLVGALDVADDLQHVDVLVCPDHKFLLHAGRGMGYCYLAPAVQEAFVPVNAGWRAGAVPFESFFGPDMILSPTASRFDTSISWLAAAGNRAPLGAFDAYGSDAVFARNLELSALLRAALADAGWTPLTLPERNRSTIVSVPLAGRDPAGVLAALADRHVIGSVRDGNLRLAVHFYNHEDDVERLVAALADLR
jgi:selenocysteine lyase/cysteine desulfurase